MIVAFEKDSINLCLQENGQEEDNRSRQREQSKTRRFIRNCPKEKNNTESGSLKLKIHFRRVEVKFSG